MFLDRDGTLNVDVGYMHRLDQLELYPWTGDALRLLKRAGYTLVVVTNQSGIARGMIDYPFHPDRARRNAKAPAGRGHRSRRHVLLPASPSGSVAEYSIDCRCRKPFTGMIDDAVRDLGIDLSRSWTVGDKWLDVQMGHAAGTRSILVRTGWGVQQETAPPEGQRVEAVCDNLMHAVSVILTSA